jgi:hypothetical protein
MSKTRRLEMKLLICPECGQIGTLRKVLYGMPDPESFDFEKYAVGGCCNNSYGSESEVSCRECNWSGLRDSFN